MSKVGIISLGCAKNQVDAEIMLSLLKESGFEIVADAALADAAIVNTCGFIESAKQEAIEEILELAALKKEGKIKALIVTGCLAERYRSELADELPEVDVVVGIGSNKDIAMAVKSALDGKKSEIFGDKNDLPLNGSRIQTTPFYYSYLKIAEGCDNRCSYCAIPMIRGDFRSRKLEDVLSEARSLASRGIREINVIAQDTTRYGEDLYGKCELPQLLRELCKIDGFEWIRVLYCYPDRVTDELLQVIAENDKIVKYMDLPIQHISGEILKSMNRRGDFKSLSALIKNIREKVPGIVLRTTLITGFPGESEEHFEELVSFVREMRFERLGCFAYSAEEGTPAALFENQVPEEISLRRQEIIMDEQAVIMDEFSLSQEGKTLNVLVEGFDRIAECWFGRSYFDAPDVDCKVFFTAKKKPHPGDFIPVKITEILGCDLIGEAI